MSRSGTLDVRIYWEDTDAGGIVYHAGYLRFLERGRTELLRDAGVDQTSLSATTGVTIAVRRMAIEFIASARLDDMLRIETAATAVRGATIALRQRILRGGEVLIEADVLVACVRAGRACRVPEPLKAALTTHG